LKRQYRHQNEGPRGEEVVIVESKLEVEEYVQSAKAQEQPETEFFNEGKIAAEFEDCVEPDADDTHQAPGGVKGVFPSVEAIFCDLDEFTDGFARVDLLKEVGIVGAVGEIGGVAVPGSDGDEGNEQGEPGNLGQCYGLGFIKNLIGVVAGLNDVGAMFS